MTSYEQKDLEILTELVMAVLPGDQSDMDYINSCGLTAMKLRDNEALISKLSDMAMRKASQRTRERALATPKVKVRRVRRRRVINQAKIDEAERKAAAARVAQKSYYERNKGKHSCQHCGKELCSRSSVKRHVKRYHTE